MFKKIHLDVQVLRIFVKTKKQPMIAIYFACLFTLDIKRKFNVCVYKMKCNQIHLFDKQPFSFDGFDANVNSHSNSNTLAFSNWCISFVYSHANACIQFLFIFQSTKKSMYSTVKCRNTCVFKSTRNAIIDFNVNSNNLCVFFAYVEMHTHVDRLWIYI